MGFAGVPAAQVVSAMTSGLAVPRKHRNCDRCGTIGLHHGKKRCCPGHGQQHLEAGRARTLRTRHGRHRRVVSIPVFVTRDLILSPKQVSYGTVQAVASSVRGCSSMGLYSTRVCASNRAPSLQRGLWADLGTVILLGLSSVPTILMVTFAKTYGARVHIDPGPAENRGARHLPSAVRSLPPLRCRWCSVP